MPSGVSRLPVILKFGRYIFITPERMPGRGFRHQARVWVCWRAAFAVIPFKSFPLLRDHRIPFLRSWCAPSSALFRVCIFGLFGVALVRFTKICLLAGLVAGAINAGFLVFSTITDA